MNLTDFPDEILEKIYSNLELDSLYNLGSRLRNLRFCLDLKFDFHVIQKIRTLIEENSGRKSHIPSARISAEIRVLLEYMEFVPKYLCIYMYIFNIYIYIYINMDITSMMTEGYFRDSQRKNAGTPIFDDSPFE